MKTTYGANLAAALLNLSNIVQEDLKTIELSGAQTKEEEEAKARDAAQMEQAFEKTYLEWTRPGVSKDLQKAQRRAKLDALRNSQFDKDKRKKK